MFDFLKVILLIGNPLLLAFVSSVIVGATLKNSDSILMIKRVVSLSVFGLYFVIYSYLVFLVQGAAMYIAMFLPFSAVLLFLIIAVIAAPKSEFKKELDKDYKMTGWDSMFPNDIDNK